MLLGLKHSLKICECILKMNSIKELPIKPEAYIEQHQISPMIQYCEHDCDATIEVFYNNKISIQHGKQLICGFNHVV